MITSEPVSHGLQFCHDSERTKPLMPSALHALPCLVHCSFHYCCLLSKVQVSFPFWDWDHLCNNVFGRTPRRLEICVNEIVCLEGYVDRQYAHSEVQALQAASQCQLRSSKSPAKLKADLLPALSPTCKRRDVAGLGGLLCQLGTTPNCARFKLTPRKSGLHPLYLGNSST